MKTLETLATSAASVSSMRAKKGRRIMAFLEVNQVKKSFGQGDTRVEVLRGIDLTVEKGKLCVLLGPSGSGKSTLLNIIGGIDGPGQRQCRHSEREDRRHERKEAVPVSQKTSGIRIPAIQPYREPHSEGKHRGGSISQ